MSMIGNTPGVSSQRTVLEEVVSGSPKSAFVPSSGYIKGYVDVLVNGIEVDSNDFTAADGITVTLASAAAVGDTVKIKAYLPRGLSDGYLKSEADAKFAALVDGNIIVAPNPGGTRVIGAASSTNTTVVIQAGAASGGGPNIELTAAGTIFNDANTHKFRSLDAATDFGTLNGYGLGVGIAQKAWGQGKAVEIGHAGNAVWSYDANNLFITKGTYWDGGWKHATTNPAGAFNMYDNYFEFRASTSTPTANGTLTWATPLTFSGATGNLGISGNLVLASGKGIDFSANSNAGGMSSELLDDYETGLWTPTLSLDGTGHSYTYFTRKYVKVGKQVTVFFAFHVTNVASQSAGVLYINGLPFTADGSANTYENGVSALLTERMGGAYSAAAAHTWFVGGVSGNTQLCVFEQNYNGSIANSTYFTSGSKSSVQIGSTNVYFIGQHTYTAA